MIDKLNVYTLKEFFYNFSRISKFACFTINNIFTINNVNTETCC